MADDPEEKLVGLSMFPKVPNYEPDISTKQSLWVRYGASPRSSLTREGWTLSKSEQQFNIDASAEVNLNMIPPSARGRRPERISLQICDAPGSFALPLKVKKQVKPNFRVAVGIAYQADAGVSFCCTLQAYLISESDRQDLPNWYETPEEGNDPLMLGSTCISHVFEADPEGPESPSRSYGDMVPQSSASQPLNYMQHEFEFSGLKVTKPSRMRKVYMLFCCRIFESDTLFVAYHVPTIVIAHITNQGARALNTLLGHVEREVGDEGDDASEGELGQGGGRSQVSRKRQPDADVGVSNYHGVVGVATPAASHGTVRQTGSQGTVRQTGSHGTANSHLASLNDPLNAPQPPGWLPDSQVGHMSASRWPQNQDAFNMSSMNPDLTAVGSSAFHAPNVGVGQIAPELALFCTREAVREYVVQKYEAAGMTRPLSEMDVCIIEAQAGFCNSPEISGEQITRDQFLKFQDWYSQMIKLLTRMCTVWNKMDPTAVTGLNVGRLEAFRALELQPPGTFLIRLSLSSPGSVVVSVRREADQSNVGVVHALIEKDDLDGRRLDTWVRDFDQATHLLDIYTGKRVPKNDVFMPEYIRLADADGEADANHIPHRADLGRRRMHTAAYP